MSVSQSFVRSTWATWPSACTPASVRPAPCTSTVSPQNAAIAAVSVPCTDGPLSCDLPAGKRRAVIFDGEFVAGHHTLLVIARFDRAIQ